MNRYRVEFKVDSKNCFIQDCEECQLEEAKKLMKRIQRLEKRGECYYRKFPLGKSETVYF
ncbi:hypothetical protein [Clostridium rectalis]|uniref:hypothetical protein n=1 Tax=Clostridium rectalis TaxID=2040295 RepID=UPI000F641AA0|nr:hypothetical protein [Clostridium rectalis]